MSASRLVRATIFSNVLINALGNSESGAIPLLHVTHVESIILRAASVTGTADVKCEYATSPDETNYDSYDDNTDIVSSTLTGKPNNTEGFNAYPVPSPLNGYIKFKVTGVAANPADTRVDAYVMLVEGEA